MKVQRRKSEAVTKADKGPLGLGVLPAIRQKLKDGFLKSFLTKMYNEAISMHPGIANNSVAHASTTDEEMNSMNIAFPDLTAEYWSTFIPEGKGVLVRVQFPDWARYTAITAYNAYGLPIASVNTINAKQGDPRLVKGTKDVYNLLSGVKWKGPIAILFRVYRPEEVEICPAEALPKYVCINQGDIDNEDVLQTMDFEDPAIYLKNSSQQEAIENGKEVEKMFHKLISGKVKNLTQKQKGTQFFAPINVSGFFVNADATYVCAWLPENKKVMKVTKFGVPSKKAFRPFYGFIAVDHKTTATHNGFIDVDFKANEEEHEEFNLFVARNEQDAAEAGYNKSSKLDKLLLWNTDVQRPGLVVRYLHYKDTDSKSSQSDALKEISALRSLDGTRTMIRKQNVEGIGEIEYL